MSASPAPSSADVVLFSLSGASLFSIRGSAVETVAAGPLRIVSTSIKAEPVVQLLVGDTFRYTLFHQPTLRSVGRAYVLVAGASEHFVLKLDDAVAAEEVDAFERVLATASVLHDNARHVLVPNDHHGMDATSVTGMTSSAEGGGSAAAPPVPPSRSVSTPTPAAAAAAAAADGSLSPASAVAAVMHPSVPTVTAPGGAPPSQTLSSGVATTTVALASPVPAVESPTTVAASYLTSGIAMGGRLLAAGAVAGAHVAGAGVKYAAETYKSWRGPAADAPEKAGAGAGTIVAAAAAPPAAEASSSTDMLSIAKTISSGTLAVASAVAHGAAVTATALGRHLAAALESSSAGGSIRAWRESETGTAVRSVAVASISAYCDVMEGLEKAAIVFSQHAAPAISSATDHVHGRSAGVTVRRGMSVAADVGMSAIYLRRAALGRVLRNAVQHGAREVAIGQTAAVTLAAPAPAARIPASNALANTNVC